MNRIILIGNGFDLAHGLPTSYKEFIDWYWEEWRKKLVSCVQNIAKDELCEFSLREKSLVWLGYLFQNYFLNYMISFIINLHEIYA